MFEHIGRPFDNYSHRLHLFLLHLNEPEDSDSSTLDEVNIFFKFLFCLLLLISLVESRIFFIFSLCLKMWVCCIRCVNNSGLRLLKVETKAIVSSLLSIFGDLNSEIGI